MKKVGILLSGRGSNFEALARSIAAREIPARIAVVISNRQDAPGLARAHALGLDARFISSQGKTREIFDAELAAALESCEVDYVCLAGFMRVLGPCLVRKFSSRVLNIHPSLLPAFPGVDAQRQALEAGVKFSGCTVHFVDEGIDTGPIVRQAVVPVLDDDTVESLSKRILEQEHRIYPEALQLLVEGRIEVEGRRVKIRKTVVSGQ
jgi:phosphoribosylglycinamide formyltransferase-1